MTDTRSVENDLPDATFAEEYLAGSEGAALRVLRWLPRQATPARPVLFVPGWVSIADGWADVIRVLSARRPVHYVETREKLSARLPDKPLRPGDFSIARMAEDLVGVASRLGMGRGEADVFASSLGATVVLEAMKRGRLDVHSAFLVGPNSSFRFPRWTLPLLRLPPQSFFVLRRLALWYLRSFKVDVRREPEQMARYERTLASAAPRRLLLSARAVQRYELWPELETIRAPVGIAFARSDRLHDAEAMQRMARALTRSELVQCPSNKHMHGAEVVADFERFSSGA